MAVSHEPTVVTDDTDPAGGNRPDDHERGTYVVAERDEGSAVLRDVESGRVLTVPDPDVDPPLARREALTATLAPDAMGVTWAVVDVGARWTVEVVDSDLSPTRRAREVAADQPEGELTRVERAGEGELHVLTVPDPAAAAADVLDDERTVERAARLGAVRVEVRTGDGVVSVRYLPD
jgi:hypothetical protein